VIYLIAGLVLFLGIHSTQLFAPGVRQSVIDTKGANAWKGIYTLISLLGFGLLIWGYGQARFDNTFFYAPPTWFSHIQLLLMLPAMVLLAASQLPVGLIKKKLKNPQLIAVKIWAIGHLLVNGDLANWLLFGSFLIWAVLLVINIKKRGQTFPDQTSSAADILAVVIGVAIWAIFAFWLHEWLIGVPAIA